MDMKAQIRTQLQMKSARSKRSKMDYSFVNSVADILPYEAQKAIYGIAWALETGRLPGQVDMVIRRMTAWEYTELIAEAVGVSQNDVPRFLISKFTGA